MALAAPVKQSLVEDAMSSPVDPSIAALDAPSWEERRFLAWLRELLAGSAGR